MIIELFIKICGSLIIWILTVLPDIPSVPSSFLTSINKVFDVIFSNLGLLPMFIRIDTIKILVPLLLIVINFEYIYNLVMWILRKIPGLSIS